MIFLVGCRASVSANLNTNERQSADTTPPPSSELTASQNAKTAFIGVTQALALADGAAAQATCRCMAAAVGLPGGGAFQWRGTPPVVGEDAMVVAIGNEKTPCENQGNFRGPSIQGVEVDGSNVIVTLEEPRPGIPVARGAVFQRPPGDGFLIFHASRRLPYGQPLPGSATQVCRLPLGEGPAGARNAGTVPSRGGYRPPVNTF